MCEEARKAKLEQDRWVADGSVKAHQVTCGGCGEDKALDNRGAYYQGFWTKHRGRCKEIKIQTMMERGNYSVRDLS